MEEYIHIGNVPTLKEKCSWSEQDFATGWATRIYTYKSDTVRRSRPAPSELYWNTTWMERIFEVTTRSPVFCGTTQHWTSHDEGADVPHENSVSSAGFSGYLGLSESIEPNARYAAAGQDWLDQLGGRIRDSVSQNNADMATNVAEWRQTRDMVKEAAERTVDNFQSIRHTHGLTGSRLAEYIIAPVGRKAKAIAGLWLQAQYGLLPLVGEIYTAAEKIAVKANAGVWGQTQKVTFNRDTSYLYASVASLAGGEVRVGVRDVYGVQTTSSASYQTQLLDDGDWRNLSAWGMTNPYALAWELIPYSFVIDQIIGVGKFLERSQALFALGGIRVNYRRLDVIRRQCEVNGTVCGTATRTHKVRYPTTSDVGLPPPQWRTHRPPPWAEGGEGPMKAFLNMVAVFTQVHK